MGNKTIVLKHRQTMAELIKFAKFLRLVFNLGLMVVGLGLLFPQTLAAIPSQFPQSESELTADDPVQPGLDALQRGDFEAAIIALSNALERQKTIGKNAPQFATLIHLSDAHQAIGESAIAITYLQSALEFARRENNRYKTSTVMSRLGNAYFRVGNHSKATQYLTEGLEQAHQIEDSTLEATALNNLGVVQMSAGDLTKARSHFQQSASLAVSSSNSQLAGKSFANLAKLTLLGESKKDAGKSIETALEYVNKTPDSHDKALQLLRIGRMAQTLSDLSADESSRWRKLSYQSFKDAEKIGSQLNDKRSLSYAQGYLGQLYMEDLAYVTKSKTQSPGQICRRKRTNEIKAAD
jgi:tetratricopeptide (TPR) repeat protein